jgi:hypothetical protein
MSDFYIKSAAAWLNVKPVLEESIPILKQLTSPDSPLSLEERLQLCQLISYAEVSIRGVDEIKKAA